MSQDVLPVNFFSRRELQLLTDRALSFYRTAHDPSVRAAVSRLATGAAALDACLADLPADLLYDPRFTAVFTKADVGRYRWVGSRFTLHTSKGMFFLALEQQAMIQPGKDGMVVGLGRYRLIIGDPDASPQYAMRIEELRPLAEQYLLQHYDLTSSECLLDQVFGEKDYRTLDYT